MDIPSIEVMLDYAEFATGKSPSPSKQKRVVLRSKLSKKKAGGKNAKAVKPKKKKHQRKKKRSDVEVTSMVEEVLEDPGDLDNDYCALKELVVAKLKEDDLFEGVSEVARTGKLEECIAGIISRNCDTFYLVDITTVILKFKNFKKYLPRVQPFFAVKCNPDPYLISTLVACGAGLDVASMPEMLKGLNAGQLPENMIFANPCKMPEHLKFAAKSGVKKMTFDNPEELRKIHKFFPEAQLVLRILADDSHSTMRFGSKFGADVQTEVRPLLSLAYELGLDVIGVSFHVGSGCQSGKAYHNSLRLAKSVFDIAEEMEHPMNFLDIGGGFLGSDTETVIFKDIAESIAVSLDELFPSNVTVIAEPGRYFASECVVLVTTVIGRRERQVEEESGLSTLVDYYISDGVYGSFNNMFFDYYSPTPVTMHKHKHNRSKSEESELAGETKEHRSTLFGPTCDSIDVVCKDIELPALEIGDHVYFFNMGAYTSAAASSFNGFNPPKAFYILS